MSQVSALVLSARSYDRRFAGLRLVVHRSIITSAADALEARFAAIAKVETEHFFFLDDDDDLPADYLSVIDECLAKRVALAYTDEIQKRHDGGPDEYIHRGPYWRERHLRHSMLVHHLALCETAQALDVVDSLPRGSYWPEFLLYWSMAARGIAYVPRAGYVWDRKITGMHTWPDVAIAQMRSRLWAKRQLEAEATDASL